MPKLNRKYIRILIIIATIGFAMACRRNTSNPNDIVNSKTITIEITLSGCFGGHKQIITINEINGERIMTSHYVRGLDEPDRKIKFDSKKKQILSDLIRLGHTLPNSGFCTNLWSYKIKTERYQCEFEDNSCKLDKYLTELIN